MAKNTFGEVVSCRKLEGRAVCVGDGGEVYLLSLQHRTVKILTPTTDSQKMATVRTIKLHGVAPRLIWDMTYSPDNTLIMTDAEAHRILKFDLADGTLSVLTGSGKPGLQNGPTSFAQFDQPFGICMNRKERCFYVSDYINHAIRQVHENRDVRTVFGGQEEKHTKLSFPDSVAIVEDRWLLVTEDNSMRIRILDLKTASVSTIEVPEFPLEKDTSGGIYTKTSPNLRICLALDRTLYIADCANRYMLSASITYSESPPKIEHCHIVMGTGNRRTVDGLGVNASFKCIFSMEVDPVNDFMYIIDGETRSESFLRRISVQWSHGFILETMKTIECSYLGQTLPTNLAQLIVMFRFGDYARKGSY